MVIYSTGTPFKGKSFSVAYVPLTFMEVSPVVCNGSASSVRQITFHPPQTVDTTSVNLFILSGPTFWQGCGGGVRASPGSLNNEEFSVVLPFLILTVVMRS